MARLFGFSIEDTEKTPAGVVSPIPPNRQDGSEYYVSSGFYGSYVDIEVYIKLKMICLEDIVRCLYIQNVIVPLKIL